MMTGLAVLLSLILCSAAAQDFGSDQRRFINALGAISGEDSKETEAPDRAVEPGMQRFVAMISGNPDELCPSQLIVTVQKHLGVKVEGASEKIAWEVANDATRSGSSYREEVRITYPGLAGLSLGPWEATPEANGRWRCSMALSTSTVDNLKDYVTLGRLKAMQLDDLTALSNAVSAVRGIAERFRARHQDDLAIEADGLLGTLTQYLLSLQLDRGQVSVSLTCELCSEKGCANVLGQLKGAGIFVTGPRWEEFRDSVLYYTDDKILRLIKPAISRLPHVETILTKTPAANGFHANLLIREDYSLGAEIRRMRGKCHAPSQ